ncbi:MAG: class I SAM-dependent methyltransferase [bacterium]|nr:class I SAM-dependent methyltransferase [bacterium]
MKKLLVSLLKQLDLGSAIAVRLTKITGKSKTPLHPKHFLEQKPWFTKYLSKKDLVLDLGSGVGQNAIKSSKFCRKIIGAEIDRKLIDLAMLSANNKHIKNIKFETGDLEKILKYKNNSFDKILFLDVLEHLNKREQILEEIKRTLKPNGLLLLGVPNSQTTWKKFQRSAGVCSYSDPDHKIEFSKKSIVSLLEKHGFKIINFSYGKYDTPFRGLFDIIGGFSIGIYKKISEWRQKKVLLEPNEASGFEIVAKNVK